MIGVGKWTLTKTNALESNITIFENQVEIHIYTNEGIVNWHIHVYSFLICHGAIIIDKLHAYG